MHHPLNTRKERPMKLGYVLNILQDIVLVVPLQLALHYQKIGTGYFLGEVRGSVVRGAVVI